MGNHQGPNCKSIPKLYRPNAALQPGLRTYDRKHRFGDLRFGLPCAKGGGCQQHQADPNQVGDQQVEHLHPDRREQVDIEDAQQDLEQYGPDQGIR